MCVFADSNSIIVVNTRPISALGVREYLLVLASFPQYASLFPALSSFFLSLKDVDTIERASARPLDFSKARESFKNIPIQIF